MRTGAVARVFLLPGLLLLPLFGCETMQAVDRGLHSATNAVSQRDRITGQQTLSLENRAEQIKKGNGFAEKIIADAKAKGRKFDAGYNPLAYERVQRIFSRLHSVSHLREEKWTAVLIEDKEWNAFTTGGTYIFIHSGLEEDLKNDAELANVIAHEIAHTVANHVFEAQGHMLASRVAGSQSARRGTFQAAFTVGNELEADRIAVLYCALAGYDPHAGGRIWRRMLETTGNNAFYVSDHPLNSERAAQAERAATLVSKHYRPGELNANYAAVLARNELFSSQQAGEAEPGKGGGALAALSTALTAAQQQQEARAAEQRQGARVAFMHSVHKVSSIVSSGPIGPSQWRITLHYGGNLALTDLSFKLIVERPGRDPLVINQRVPGVLRPNSRANVDFHSPELETSKTSPRSVRFMYDNARPL
jgi:predicted Zn-dependent protease